MPKQTVRLARHWPGSVGGPRDIALDIVSYGRRGPAGTRHLGTEQIAQIRRTVARTPEVMVKVSGGAREVGGVDAHLRYIGRHGKLTIETDEGPALQGRGTARAIVADWQLDLCEGTHQPRPEKGKKDLRAKLVHNIVLSMPNGTPPQKVLAAARVFARENFALQYRYALVLHTDQPHPHVHLVVKCEHEFEPRRRLYIRKDTLRQWREQFAALMREQGVAANATPRQVRGQVRQPYRDAIHHRMRDLRSFEQRMVWRQSKGRPPKISTFLRAKLIGVLQALRSDRGALGAGREAMQTTRQAVIADWHVTARALRQQGKGDLAAQVDLFIARMPAVQTDAQRIAHRWTAAEKCRTAERTPAAPPRPRDR